MVIKRVNRVQNKPKKEGQIDISFGFIFGIIIIIATLAIAFYVISHFMRLSRCSDTGLFYSDLQSEIDKAWASSMTQKTFTGKLPGNINSICFGNLTLGNPVNTSRTQYESLLRFKGLGKNVFLYPFTNACNTQLANSLAEHVQIPRFFCVPVEDGKVTITLSKNSTSAYVLLSK
jgi:hypothetical protein